MPALPELFSEYDEMQGHRRRYTKELLRRAFEQSGFSVKAMHWWGAWMVPILKVMRKRGRNPQQPPKTYSQYLRIPPWPAPWLMRGIYDIEALPSVLSRLPIGTSLIAVAKRQS